MNDKIEQAITYVQIKARISTLEAELKKFIDQANLQVAAYEQRIAELKELIKDDAAVDS